MTTSPIVIYREWNTIVGVNFSMMFNQVATDIVYPNFIVAFTPFAIFFPCQCFVNTNRIVP